MSNTLKQSPAAMQVLAQSVGFSPYIYLAQYIDNDTGDTIKVLSDAPSFDFENALNEAVHIVYGSRTTFDMLSDDEKMAILGSLYHDKLISIKSKINNGVLLMHVPNRIDILLSNKIINAVAETKDAYHPKIQSKPKSSSTKEETSEILVPNAIDGKITLPTTLIVTPLPYRAQPSGKLHLDIVKNKVLNINPGEAYTVLSGDTLSEIAAGWGIPLKDLYAVEANTKYAKNPRRLQIGSLVYRPGEPATVVPVVDVLPTPEPVTSPVIIEEGPIRLVKDDDHYVPDYEAYLLQEYPNMVEIELPFKPYSRRQQRFLQRNRAALRKARAYDEENGTDTYWQLMSKMPTKRVGGVLNPLPKRKIFLHN